MRTRRETFAYIGAAIIIVELMFLIGVNVLARAAEVASLANAIEIEETCPVEETAAVYHLEADAPTWNTLVNNPKLADLPTDAPQATEEAPAVYKDIVVSEEEFKLLRSILALEADYDTEGFDGQKAVVEVVFNRVLSDKWPNTVKDVIYQKGQFSTVKYLKNPYNMPGEHEDDAISEVLRETETVLPDIRYVYFDTKGKNGKDHIRLHHHVFGR